MSGKEWGLTPIIKIGKKEVDPNKKRWYEDVVNYAKIQEITKDIKPAKVWILDDTAIVTNSTLIPAVDEIWEFTTGTGTSGYHGHHVGGIIACTKYGIHSKIPVSMAKVLSDASGTGMIEWIVNGIKQGAINGYELMNASMGSDFPAADIKTAIGNFLQNPKHFFIAAAGNDARETDYPAAWANEMQGLIAVGAIDKVTKNFTLKLADYSSSGVVTVVMPGTDIISTFPDEQYFEMSGTSMATPFVTALLSICKGINPDLNQETFVELLKKHSKSIDDNNLKDGYGFPDFVAIFEELKGLKIKPQQPKKKRGCRLFR